MNGVLFEKAVDDFLRAAHRTYESGIQTGTGGNLSVRVPGEDKMIVKPSGFSYGECTRENLCITDFDGNLLEGDHKPTRECTLHGNLYRHYADIGGIVHTHSVYAILCSMKMEQIENVTLHTELKFGTPVPVVDVLTQAVTLEEMPKVYAAMDLTPRPPAFVLRRHGIVAFDKTAVKAEQTAELVEETAQIAWELYRLEHGK